MAALFSQKENLVPKIQVFLDVTPLWVVGLFDPEDGTVLLRNVGGCFPVDILCWVTVWCYLIVVFFMPFAFCNVTRFVLLGALAKLRC